MHSHGVDVCVVEDDPDQRRLLVEHLRHVGYGVVEADDGPPALRCIYEHRPRILLCDVELPNLSGIQLCRQVRADPTLDGTYIVVVTAQDRDGRRYRVLGAGADDYLCKPFDLAELRARIRNGMRLHRLQERLKQAALTDGLTGLCSYNHFRELLEREFQRTRRYGGALSLIMLDLDHFKAINDNYGHEVGNRVLKCAARHLRRSVRRSDIVARYGGEEFAVICPETRLEAAVELCERLRTSTIEQVRLKDYPRIVVRMSIGVANTEDPRARTLTELVNLGDHALYQAKRSGRDRIVRCDELQDLPAQASLPPDDVEWLRKEVVTLSARSSDLCAQTIQALLAALETRDPCSAWHARNVAEYTQRLVEATDWSAPLRGAAANAAMLYDLGKIGVPDGLLLHDRTLGPQEAAILRQVPLITCKVLEPLKVFETEIVMIRHLRERWDGSGYPDGLCGNSIPIGSRLIAVAEAFDALTCGQVLPCGRSIDEALAAIRDQAGKQFDPQFCEFLEHVVAAQRDAWEERVRQARRREPTRQTAPVSPSAG